VSGGSLRGLTQVIGLLAIRVWKTGFGLKTDQNSKIVLLKTDQNSKIENVKLKTGCIS
jgi:hypothetical protein